MKRLGISRQLIAMAFPLGVLGVFAWMGIVTAQESAKPTAASAEEKAKGKSLKALMITGGCCHDYEKQKMIISAGISERANVDWTIVHEGGTSRDHKVSTYSKDNWTDGYDVIVHNECFGAVKDPEFVTKLAKAHEKVPAVVLHCTMHSYRASSAADEWRKFLGVTSTNHGKHHAITIENKKPEHPVMKAFPKSWKTPKGELYNIKKVWDTATPLATGYLTDPAKTHVCIWVNEYGKSKSRVFATTIGHHNETMVENTYLDLLTRGLLWATGKLGDDGKPAAGFGKKSAK